MINRPPKSLISTPILSELVDAFSVSEYVGRYKNYGAVLSEVM